MVHLLLLAACLSWPSVLSARPKRGSPAPAPSILSARPKRGNPAPAPSVLSARPKRGSPVSSIRTNADIISNMTALRKHLLEPYDDEVMPWGVVVRVQWSLRQVLAVNTVDQTITVSDCMVTVDERITGSGREVAVTMTMAETHANPPPPSSLPLLQVMGWWRQYWIDPRMSWDPNEWGGVETLIFKGNGGLEQEVWVPDTLVYQKIDATDGTQSQDVSMSSTGDAFLSVPRVQTISCRMDLESFP